jgi:hypothetical protein
VRWLPLALVVVMACGDGSAETTTATSAATTPVAEGCADVVAATARQDPDGTWSFSVTVSSADTGWDKYADAWEVRDPAGAALGTRVLLHPHETEQPFTRSLSGVAVPAGTTEVVIAARDSVEGWCGEELRLVLGS